MALISTWSHANTSNRIISRPLDVSYSITEIEFEGDPSGDPPTPQDVTDAETKVTYYTSKLEDVADSIDETEGDVATAEIAENSAYENMKNNPTEPSYRSVWMRAKSYLSCVSARYSSLLDDYDRYERLVSLWKSNRFDALCAWAIASGKPFKNGKPIAYEYRRMAKMSMSFVGFTSGAASDCKAYYDSLYTRSIAKSARFVDGEPDVNRITYNPSSVTISRNGNSYEVNIEVNEDDVALSTTLETPATLFVVENSRVYL